MEHDVSASAIGIKRPWTPATKGIMHPWRILRSAWTWRTVCISQFLPGRANCLMGLSGLAEVILTSTQSCRPSASTMSPSALWMARTSPGASTSIDMFCSLTADIPAWRAACAMWSLSLSRRLQTCPQLQHAEWTAHASSVALQPGGARCDLLVERRILTVAAATPPKHNLGEPR